MKNFKFFAVFCMMFMFATAANAQFVSTGNSSSGNYGGGAANEFTSMRVSYMPVSIENVDLNGVNVAWIKTKAISQDMPLFVESGLGFSWIGGDLGDSDFKLNFFSLNVPVNLGYELALNNGMSVSPFVGLDLRGNLFGKYKIDGESIDAFDEDELEDWYLEESKLERFNVGWRIGVAFNVNNLYLGASYGDDFNDVAEGSKASLPQFTIGFKF